MSAVSFGDGGIKVFLNCVRNDLSTASWRTLYLLRSLATLQQLRTWIKDHRFPQSRHESLSFFLHRWRFELWASVSSATLRANFICSWGRHWIALAEIVAVFDVVALSIWPCLSRLHNIYFSEWWVCSWITADHVFCSATAASCYSTINARPLFYRVLQHLCNTKAQSIEVTSCVATKWGIVRRCIAELFIGE